MRRLLLAVAAAAVLVLGTTLAGRAATLDRARALAASGDRDRARAALDSLLALPDALGSDDRAAAGYLRAQLEVDGSAYQSRLRDLLSREKDPAREAALHLDLGRALFAQGNLEVALHEFSEARDRGREEEGSLWEGITAMALGDGSAAREALERAAASGNRGIRQRALVAIGDSYRLAGQWEEAASRYAKVEIDLDGGPGWWPTAAIQRAECLENLGRHDDAVAAWEEILRRAPGSYAAPRARSRLRESAAEVPAGGPPPEAVPAPGTPADTTAAAFTLQVGAFKVQDNAEALAATVRGRGFDPVRVAKGADGLFRVLVGSFAGRGRAESVGDSLGVALGLGYSVVPEGGR